MKANEIQITQTPVGHCSVSNMTELRTFYKKLEENSQKNKEQNTEIKRKELFIKNRKETFYTKQEENTQKRGKKILYEKQEESSQKSKEGNSEMKKETLIPQSHRT